MLSLTSDETLNMPLQDFSSWWWTSIIEIQKIVASQPQPRLVSDDVSKSVVE